MPSITVDLPEILDRYIESEIERGQYQSKAEALRDIVRKEMERKHTSKEKLAEEVETNQECGENRGDLNKLIGDLF